MWSDWTSTLRYQCRHRILPPVTSCSSTDGLTTQVFDLPRAKKGQHFVRPKLVAQVGFSEWTRDGKLRHPRFLGLRNDKRAEDVRRERPAR